MAVVGRLISKEIEYGNPTDVRMNIVTPLTPTTSSNILNVCPDGGTFVGYVNGVPKCVTSPKKYRNQDKQIAFEKAKEQDIIFTGQYTKDETTGEVTPKPLQVLLEEAKGGISGISTEDNLLKKYWWVLAAIGVYIIISND